LEWPLGSTVDPAFAPRFQWPLLAIGLLWALWHVLVDFRQNFNAQGLALLLEFVVLYIATLSAYRLLMTWVYAHTQSLLLAVLMHASYTGWLLVLNPATSIKQALARQTFLSAALWAVVAVILSPSKPRRSSFKHHGCSQSVSLHLTA